MQDSHEPGERPNRTFPRRRFLRSSALLAGGAVTAATLPMDAAAASVAPVRIQAWLAALAQATPEAIAGYVPEALSATELATLIAAIDRIIPADELGPGASEAAVQIFIDHALAGPYAALLSLYQSGLAALDAVAGTGGFAALAEDEQDAILTQAEAGKLADGPDGFFALLVEHTRQGMFGDPIYGGNADFAGWDLIGYPGMKLLWTEEEQQIDTVVQPAHVSVEEYGGQGW
jgi:gluconate 2-dehydrogenase gamma chain